MVANVPLMDIHGSLSRLAFAVQQCLGDIACSVEVNWNPTNYLNVVIECYGGNVQKVADRLRHGVLQGEYDYRFKSVCSPTGMDKYDWVTVVAYPNMQHQ